ncbi:hypothetical protein Dalk_4584 [Desulfatibacillum aliphaticivorans]|uniref:Uncharacterized protein n=1 Tax=Desulfatibacillum aliphaticivorans TaxID=218208 RepID=B8FNI1_DESAL|nr:hypothetical protein [Desulfatibacillum aliphaticivorans]ACL06262.1 hypothetical protein Dalk_4584 [Desulfatibacillum aliphaticivorans]
MKITFSNFIKRKCCTDPDLDDRTRAHEMAKVLQCNEHWPDIMLQCVCDKDVRKNLGFAPLLVFQALRQGEESGHTFESREEFNAMLVEGMKDHDKMLFSLRKRTPPPIDDTVDRGMV